MEDHQVINVESPATTIPKQPRRRVRYCFCLRPIVILAVGMSSTAFVLWMFYVRLVQLEEIVDKELTPIH
jgi:hypothetical protein